MPRIEQGQKADDLTIVRLSSSSREVRRDLIDRYRRTVYEPAFPDPEIREDPEYWRALLDAEDYPPPPQPRIDVVLALHPDAAVAGGVTVELYRDAGCGLLTYIAVAASDRGRGIGSRLVAEASKAVTAMAGHEVPIYAETERYGDARSETAHAATRIRQRQLAGLGARAIDFDYWMPPLRPGLLPHQLHLLIFGDHAAVPAAQVHALLDELARALKTDLADFPQTRAMVSALEERVSLTTATLPMADAR